MQHDDDDGPAQPHARPAAADIRPVPRRAAQDASPGQGSRPARPGAAGGAVGAAGAAGGAVDAAGYAGAADKCRAGAARRLAGVAGASIGFGRRRGRSTSGRRGFCGRTSRGALGLTFCGGVVGCEVCS